MRGGREQHNSVRKRSIMLCGGRGGWAPTDNIRAKAFDELARICEKQI